MAAEPDAEDALPGLPCLLGGSRAVRTVLTLSLRWFLRLSVGVMTGAAPCVLAVKRVGVCELSPGALRGSGRS